MVVFLSLKIVLSSLYNITEPFRVAFAEKTYNVTESEGQVEVCVNLTYPEMDIHNETVRVESYNNGQTPIHIPPDAVLASEPPLYSFAC